MTSSNRLRSVVVFTLLAALPFGSHADQRHAALDGHLKVRGLADRFPGDSVFNALAGSGAHALEADLRVNASVGAGDWSLDAAWQLYTGIGDRVSLARALQAGGSLGANRQQNDERRLLNLTHDIEDDRDVAALHRIDRLAVSYATDDFVLRAGRQALSWGNGLVFSPMDIVNPLDPTAVDTEYKSGDDMLYGQYLLKDGDDLQAAVVFRRNPLTGNVDPDERTAAIKYHGVLENAEFDLLIAAHYDRTTFGVGGNMSVGGAVVRGDLVVTDTPAGRRSEWVANLSHSWVWRGRNVSAVLEYFHSDFGLGSNGIDLASLATDPQLAARLARGQTFTVGRDYLAGGATIEVTPLLLLTPNLFWNLSDGSALFQVVARYSAGDNRELIAAINAPLGPSGTEFGGIGSGLPGNYLSTDLGIFLQFGWYF